MSDIDGKIDALITGVDMLRSEMADMKRELKTDISRVEAKIDEISEKLLAPEEERGVYL